MASKHLTVVPAKDPSPAEKHRQRIKRMPKPDSMIECRCGSRSLIAELNGAVLRNGKVVGGTKVMLCASCFAKGERVVVA